MFDVTVLTAAADAAAAEVPYLSLHTAGDVSDSTDEAASVARVAAGWVNVDGTLTAIVSFSGDADLPVTRVGYWSASTGGTFKGGAYLPSGTVLSGTGDFEATVVETGYTA